MSDTTQDIFITRDCARRLLWGPPPARTLTTHMALHRPSSDTAHAAPGLLGRDWPSAGHRVVSQKLNDHLAGPTVSSWGWAELALGSPVNQNLLQQELGSPAFNLDQWEDWSDWCLGSGAWRVGQTPRCAGLFIFTSNATWWGTGCRLWVGGVEGRQLLLQSRDGAMWLKTDAGFPSDSWLWIAGCGEGGEVSAS